MRGAMTEEEITRFALQLREAERIRALMARDADSKDGFPLATGPVVDYAGCWIWTSENHLVHSLW